MPASPSLPPTAWAVLGLLSFGRDLTGYELKKWADASLRFFYWSPATSQIYAECKRLERLGYVESDRVAQDELRDKRVYRITDAGRVALRDWVQHAPVEPPILKHGVVLRAWLGHLADPAQLRAVVEQHRQQLDATLEEIHTDRERATLSPEWEYPEAVLRWAEARVRSDRELTDQLLADLDRIAEKAAARSSS